MGDCQNHGPFGLPDIIRHALFKIPKMDPNFDTYPHISRLLGPKTILHKASVLFRALG